MYSLKLGLFTEEAKTDDQTSSVTISELCQDLNADIYIQTHTLTAGVVDVYLCYQPQEGELHEYIYICVMKVSDQENGIQYCVDSKYFM